MNLHLNCERETIELPDGSQLHYYPHYFAAQADVLFKALREEIAWRADTITVYGRQIAIPRLQAWYGEPQAIYQYSGLPLEPLAWTPVLKEVKLAVEQGCDVPFNSVLANLYRHGADSVSWHSDDEPELGPQPVVASVSFGAQRRFQLRPKSKQQGRKDVLNLSLGHGSLLLMNPGVQHYWRHQVPKTRQKVAARINLTFRQCCMHGAINNAADH